MASNKQAAINFLQFASSGKVDEAYKNVAMDFSHHNLYFKGDRHSLMTAMQKNAAANPNRIFEVKQVIEEGDLVVTHSFVKPESLPKGMAVVHIFKFRQGQIVEMWDIGAPIPEDSPNEKGAF